MRRSIDYIHFFYNRGMNKLLTMLAFVRVAESGSFTAAAAALEQMDKVFFPAVDCRARRLAYHSFPQPAPH
jgi:hypothetical protein